MGNKGSYGVDVATGGTEVSDKKEPVDERIENLPRELTLNHHLGNFIGCEKYADVVFIVGPKKKPIFGHKVILAARSSHFRAIFDSWNRNAKETESATAELKEKGNEHRAGLAEDSADALSASAPMQKVDVPDVAISVFVTLMKCIYSDTTDLKPNTVAEVLRAAKKYKIQALEEACSAYMAQGVTLDNVVGMLELAEKAALPFALENGDELVAHPSFVELPPETLLMLVKSDKLNAAEVDLFKAVVKWAEEIVFNSKAGQQLADTPEGLRGALEHILPHIRFPLMSMEDFTHEVVPTRILTKEEQLQAFQAIAAKKTDLKPECKFSSVPREGSRAKFKWDVGQQHHDLVVLDNGRMVTSQNMMWKTIVGHKPLKKGVLEFKIKLEQYTRSNGLNVAVGVVPGDFPANVNKATVSEVTQPVGKNNCGGWSFIAGNGRVFAPGNNGGVHKCPVLKVGDVISVRVELPQGRIEFGVNERKFGVCFNGLIGPLIPALSVYGNQRVSLHFD